MRWMASGVITLVLVGLGCASKPQDSGSGRTAQPTNRLVSAATNQSPGSPNAQILLDKIKADKKLLVATNMDLTDAEAARFWPLYDEYQRGLDQINQRLASTILEYAAAHDKGPIPDATATKRAAISAIRSADAVSTTQPPPLSTRRISRTSVASRIRSLNPANSTNSST